MIPPVVSVIIPVYNRAATIARSIDSVLAQTYQSIELIVVDDGSTDRTVEVIRGYGDCVNLICQPNGGPSSARNTGVAHASGEIVAFLDSDDSWMADKLERQVKLMLRGGSQVPCCICNASLIEDDGSSKTSFDISGVSCKLHEGYWLNPALIIATRFLLFNQVVAIRREAFESIGGFNEDMRLLEDYDLAFRLSLLGPWGFIGDTLVEKYNDSQGVGVLAMRNPLVHAKAWSNALNGFLQQPLVPASGVEAWIRRNLRNVRIELQAVSMMSKPWAYARLIGRLLMLFLRIEGAIRRRLPSWPKVRPVKQLAAAEPNTVASQPTAHDSPQFPD